MELLSRYNFETPLSNIEKPLPQRCGISMSIYKNKSRLVYSVLIADMRLADFDREISLD